MNHSVSQAADPHEAKLRLMKLERKIESNKLGQLKVKVTGDLRCRATGGTAFQVGYLGRDDLNLGCPQDSGAAFEKELVVFAVGIGCRIK